MPSMRRLRCCAVFTAAALAQPGCSRDRDPRGAAPGEARDATFLGRDACVECHTAEHDAYLDSHHDLAMQPATTDAVLGDFDNASLEHFGVTSRFLTRDGTYLAETDSPGGAAREYPIKYTFGVYPLQQYLVQFPGGRLQVLPLCWDTRPASQGGQRWFHLYPDEPIPHGDILHWTGPNQNWNFMCAECHSTDLHKNYDPTADAFATAWSEIDVSCEACHGPGSAHVAWAERTGDTATAPDAATARLTIDLNDRDGAAWIFAPDSPTASRSTPRTSQTEIEMCARCHARRAALTDDYRHGKPILDSHRVSLLTEPEYFADGQVLEEDYVYASFLQSRMHGAGVTCTDCHDPHTARLRAPGDGLCLQCHKQSVFGVVSHSRHATVEDADQQATPQPTPQVTCVDCHMPVRTYMVVDDRHDHSFRVPRPDLSATLGAPNTCNACHDDQSSQWAAGHIAEWFGPDRRREWRFGEALHAGRAGLRGAVEQLARLAADPEQPPIARATGLTLFAQYPGPELLEAARSGLTDPDPLVRMGALAALEGIAPQERPLLAGHLLTDPLLAVRAEAARLLAPAVSDSSPPALQHAFAEAADDFVATQLASAERPESHINLAVFHTDCALLDDAEREYRTALRLDPACIPASVNLADLRRLQGRDAEGEQILRDALRRSPQSAALRHALGLTLIRLDRRDEALIELERACEWGPDEPRHGYVFAVALDSLGQSARALDVMRATHDLHPLDRDILAALVGMCRRRGLIDDAARYEEQLDARSP